MDELEKYIKKNRGAFEEKGPDDAVWEKLQKNLKEISPKSPRRKNMHFSKTAKKWTAIAAAFLLCISFAAFVRTFQVKHKIQRQSIPADLVEARAYYKGLIDNHIAQINKMDAAFTEGDSTIWHLFGEDDKEYQRLKEDLKVNPDNPHVRAAFVEYYRSRLEVLKRIQKRIAQRKDEKN